MCAVAIGSNISVTASFVGRRLTSLELLPLSGHSAHGWTCPRLDPVAFALFQTCHDTRWNYRVAQNFDGDQAQFRRWGLDYHG